MMNRRDPVAIRICAEEQTSSERSLGKIVDFFGIESRFIDARGLTTIDPTTLSDDTPYSVLVSAVHLASAVTAGGSLPPLLRRAESVFVFGFDRSERSRGLLRALTGRLGAACDVRPATGRTLAVTPTRPDICGALS